MPGTNSFFYRQFLLLFLLPAFLVPATGFAQKAKLPANYPYKLSWRVDAPLAAAGLLATAIALPLQPRYLSQAGVAGLNRYDVNSFDRIAIGNHNTAADLTSDFIQYSMVALAGVSTMAMSEFRGPEFGTLFTMLAETFVLQLGVSYAFKNGISRPRPYVYNPGFSNQGLGRSDFQSMISAHSCTVFMAATFISTVFSDLYPDNKAKYAVWAVSLSAATAAACLRVVAGEHYPTDIIAGAVVGGIIGWAVPSLHKLHIRWNKGKADLRMKPFGGPNGVGMGFRLTLN